MRHRLLPLAALLAALALTACGGGGGETTDTDTGTTTGTEPATGTETDAPQAAGETVQITGVNYAFEGVPEEISAGTELTFTNGSDNEFHEVVVMRINDDETRSIEELLQLPEEEAGQVTQFVGVLVAFPGEEGVNPEDPQGEAVIPLEQSGRYALLCFIPTGADPEAFRAAIEGGATEPPQVDGGPPHFTQGMAAELVVSE